MTSLTMFKDYQIWVWSDISDKLSGRNFPSIMSAED